MASTRLAARGWRCLCLGSGPSLAAWRPLAAGPALHTTCSSSSSRGQQQWAGICSSASKDAAAAAAAAAAAPPSGPLTYIPERIGFIGAGQMGEALIRGFLRSKVSSPGRICVSVKDVERQDALERLGIGSIFGDATDGGSRDVARFSSVIMLCTKPQAMGEVLASLAPHVTRDHLVISIAAGITLQTLEAALGEGVRVVRVMPNTPVLGECFHAPTHSHGPHASDADVVDLLLSSVGFCLAVEEKQLDAVTGLSGSGPAFVYLMIEALADGGVMAGLHRDTALALAAKTVAGAAQMVFSDDGGGGSGGSSSLGMVHPGVLKDRVASPAGTTIAGLAELEVSGVRGAFIRAVNAAAQRSRELAG
ncbi:hypothetical protein CHLNCDRAFT_36918 [Chlorella variabilis]|uniref:Pyrroline-5-carboxylate reductase n=1 Tax=Chlorella variabilis TaxID=554065 RepID=E1ZPL2_CHLVA|nr:hypothetical protein CHLNCDRAFT_36918 [Chlorella variabilis]EFN52344.1 hypothetical protein CHLNCDRAFT_36918 [Chlorella variabilis]|eukprot:XP_005844446.1 hypothetical protein CHLNCDRAFT_36918 [Chlorella variabilis]